MRLRLLTIFFLLSSVFLYCQDAEIETEENNNVSYSDMVAALDNAERKIIQTDNPSVILEAEQNVENVLESDYTQLHPRARVLLYLGKEQLRTIHNLNTENEAIVLGPVFAKRNFTPATWICIGVGAGGFLSFLTLRLIADSVYYNDYADLGRDQAEKAAESMNTWRLLDNSAYISLGVGTLGFTLAPLFSKYSEDNPVNTGDDEYLLNRVSSLEKYTALKVKREQYIAEYEKALKKRPLRRTLTITSIGLTVAAGVSTGIFAYLGREAYIDYSAAVQSADAQDYKAYAEMFDVLTISSGIATGLFGFGSVMLAGSGPSPEKIRQEISAIDYQLDNWVEY